MSQKIQSPSIYTEIKESLRLSIPLCATYLVQAASGFVGTMMIARLGETALAATSLVSNIYMTIIVFLFGFFAAVSVLVSQNFGADNPDKVRLVTMQGFILSILVSIPMMLGVWFAPIVLRWSGQNPQVIADAVPYFHSLMWGIFPLSILYVMEQFLIGIGRTRLVLMVSLVEVPLEIFFCYIFIFGKFGLPKLGIAGLGYGFAIVFVLVLIALFFVTNYAPSCRKYAIYSKWFEVSKHYIWELVHIGVPIGIMYIIEVACYAILALMMGRLGDTVLAAHQITTQFGGFTFMIILGISNASTVMAGHSVGRKDRVGLQRGAYVGMGVGMAIILLIVSIYRFFPQWPISLDVNVHAQATQSLVHYAMIFLGIMAFAQLFDMFRFSMLGALRGLKDTKVPLYISAVSFWLIGLPLAYLFGLRWHWGGAGLWWGLTVGIFINALVLLWRFKRLSAKVDLEKLMA